LAVLLFNRFVALAGAFAQTFNIAYFNFAAYVLNNPSFVKSARNGSHPRTPDTKHFSQKFLRERKLIASRQIAGAQQPAAKSSINFMICHASRGLLRLRKQRLLMAHDP
jgi:hypothetical protein